jgi:hypothetical protein
MLLQDFRNKVNWMYWVYWWEYRCTCVVAEAGHAGGWPEADGYGLLNGISRQKVNITQTNNNIAAVGDVHADRENYIDRIYYNFIYTDS